MGYGVGWVYDYNYKYYNSYNGPEILKVTDHGDWTWAGDSKGFGPQARLAGDIVRSQLQVGLRVHKEAEKTFYGLDLGVGAKLLLGIDVNLRLGISR